MWWLKVYNLCIKKRASALFLKTHVFHAFSSLAFFFLKARHKFIKPRDDMLRCSKKFFCAFIIFRRSFPFYPQCLQIFLQALRKNLQALRIERLPHAVIPFGRTNADDGRGETLLWGLCFAPFHRRFHAFSHDRKRRTFERLVNGLKPSVRFRKLLA